MAKKLSKETRKELIAYLRKETENKKRLELKNLTEELIIADIKNKRLSRLIRGDKHQKKIEQLEKRIEQIKKELDSPQFAKLSWSVGDEIQRRSRMFRPQYKQLNPDRSVTSVPLQ